MSYNTQEISVASGTPVELYRFALGQQVWTVTSGREVLIYQNEPYQPVVIRRSAIEQSPEFARNGIDLDCARDFAVAQLFAAARPNGVVSLTVFRNHLGDDEFITWWKGRVASVVWSRIFLKEKLSWKHYAMIALVVAGIVILGVYDA